MDFEKTLRSLVAVRASVPEKAFTAGTLGTRREGSGVVIRENGLVLTIGYLITEATEVWLTRYDGRVVPAYVTAYDRRRFPSVIQMRHLSKMLSSLPTVRDNMCGGI